MDILLLQAAALHLPSGKRASVIVYDGTEDLGLWRPPGRDRELWDTYGQELREVLDKERARLPGGRLPLGGLLRVHPGKLHCDFLLWAASRPPHGHTEPAPAPGLETLSAIARGAIELAARHNAVRIAFPALGAGKGEAPAAERMAAIVRAAAAYKEACFAATLAPQLEEVIVCDPSAGNVAKARSLAARLARAGYAPTDAPARSPRAPLGAREGPKHARRRGAPSLSPDEIARARGSADAYDRARLYGPGEWLIHPSFGVGRVQQVRPERMIVVLFEHGDERTMIHGR